MRYGIKEMTLRALRTAPLLLLLLTSCEKDGGSPAFIRVRTPIVQHNNDGSEVTSSITDLWVFVNDEPIGVWQPNRRIPVLADGSTTIKLIGGVRLNGITDQRIQYPYFATYSTTVDLEVGAETMIEPVFHYYEDRLPLEDFEDIGESFIYTAGDTVFKHYDSGEGPVRSGTYSGKIVLDPEHPTFHALSNPTDPFILGSSGTFLEIDYRSDTRFLIGLTFELNGQTYSQPYLFVAPTKLGDGTLPWKHIYVDLGTYWASGGDATRKFYIAAALENGATSAYIAMDNIRVTH